MIAHLKDRAAALAALGWTGQDAEWLAFVCLHSGVFLRSQYLAFTGEASSSAAARFIERCGAAAVEDTLNGSGRLLVCRIMARPVYRALGAEHIRHRRAASHGLVVRRLLSLDYVLDHAALPWLVTEDEKVTALTAAGVPAAALPRRVYEGQQPGTGQTRYFVHKLPVALDADRATFVFVQPPGDITQKALRAWGASHAALWAALRASGRAVGVVVVGHDPERLAAAQQVVQGWLATGPAAVEKDVAAELTALRAAVTAVDVDVFRREGGLDAVLDRIVALEDHETARPARVAPHITSGEIWRSGRVAVP